MIQFLNYKKSLQRIQFFSKNLRLLAIILFFCGLSCSCSKTDDKPRTTDNNNLEKVLLETKDINGQTINKNYKNKTIYVVNLWASWCPPCKAETPPLLRFVNSHKDKIQLFSISADESEKDIRDFLKLFPLSNANNIFIAMDKQQLWAQALQVEKLPETFIFDQNWKLLKRFSGALDLSSSEFISFFEKIL